MAKKIDKTTYPSKTEVEEFEVLSPHLSGLMQEVKALSQKKQDGVLNAYKVKMINKVLLKAKQLLDNHPSAEFLELLDEETMPTNSDALFMIVQFKSAMDRFKNKFFVQENSDDFMHTGITYKWETKD